MLRPSGIASWPARRVPGLAGVGLGLMWSMRRAMPRVQERIAREGRAVGVRRAAESARAEAAVGAARAAGAMKVL
ncbi:hypothetical protein AAFF_G00345380 [Aldrovandia affinis]|uniref:Uncharacterized protein n=1 Tax=Aldrovandia affinis TaxID=143900 RepID=A0AAD7R615_9TELE|nr:hypothetical protein AAFF_G00345380 [Aldrovandia affinis]